MDILESLRVERTNWCWWFRLRWLQSYCLLFLAMIAILGAYVTELMRRFAWLSARDAATLGRIDPLTGLSNSHEFNRLFPKVLILQLLRAPCNTRGRQGSKR